MKRMEAYTDASIVRYKGKSVIGYAYKLWYDKRLISFGSGVILGENIGSVEAENIGAQLATVVAEAMLIYPADSIEVYTDCAPLADNKGVVQRLVQIKTLDESRKIVGKRRKLPLSYIYTTREDSMMIEVHDLAREAADGYFRKRRQNKQNS